MTISQKQLIANRANAQKSTGPQTVAGRHAASQNAVTHGFYAGDTVINSPNLKESQIAYDQLLQGMLDELKPEGPFQRQLVHTITNCLWRQRRAIIAEIAHLNCELESQHENYLRWDKIADDEDQTLTDASRLQRLATRATSRSIPTGPFCLALLRYEMRLDVRLARAYKLLQHLQQKTVENEENTPPKKIRMQNEPISKP